MLFWAGWWIGDPHPMRAVLAGPFVAFFGLALVPTRQYDRRARRFLAAHQSTVG